MNPTPHQRELKVTLVPRDEKDDDSETPIELSSAGVLDHSTNDRYPDQSPQAV